MLDCTHATAALSPEITEVNAQLRTFAERTVNVEYFELSAYLCPDAVCSALAADGKPLYHDTSHLALAASWRIGKCLMQDEGVPFPFTLVADWPRAKVNRLQK